MKPKKAAFAAFFFLTLEVSFGLFLNGGRIDNSLNNIDACNAH